MTVEAVQEFRPTTTIVLVVRIRTTQLRVNAVLAQIWASYHYRFSSRVEDSVISQFALSVSCSSRSAVIDPSYSFYRRQMRLSKKLITIKSVVILELTKEGRVAYLLWIDIVTMSRAVKSIVVNLEAAVVLVKLAHHQRIIINTWLRPYLLYRLHIAYRPHFWQRIYLSSVCVVQLVIQNVRHLSSKCLSKLSQSWLKRLQIKVHQPLWRQVASYQDAVRRLIISQLKLINLTQM